MVNEFEFYKYSDGRVVTAYRIENSFKENVVILNYGAMIQSACVLDKYGNISDVVIGISAENFESGKLSGSILGRCANRIAYGKFSINGHPYQLTSVFNTPNNPHHLHGGVGALGKKFFSATYDSDSQSVSLYVKDNGEDGWECAADVRVTYTFNDEHQLIIDYEMSADGDTVLCPSNHVHFNLNMPDSVQDTVVQILADEYAVKDDNIGMPNGNINRVDGLPIDLRTPASIREAIAKDTNAFLGNGRFDVSYIIPGEGVRRSAQIYLPSNGRTITVYSDMQCLIFFTPGMPKPTYFKGNMMSGMVGLCLETQYVPNAVNCREYQSPVFLKGETLKSRTVYEFGVRC